jgi:hypothetical protein
VGAERLMIRIRATGFTERASIAGMEDDASDKSAGTAR